MDADSITRASDKMPMARRVDADSTGSTARRRNAASGILSDALKIAT
jgi:hypothetical protein